MTSVNNLSKLQVSFLKNEDDNTIYFKEFWRLNEIVYIKRFVLGLTTLESLKKKNACFFSPVIYILEKADWAKVTLASFTHFPLMF